MTDSLFFNMIYLLTSVFIVFVIFKFMTLFFYECRVSRKIKILLYAGYFLVNSFINIFLAEPVINLSVNAALIFLLTFMYKSLFRQKVVAAFIVCASFFLIENVIYYIVRYFEWEHDLEVTIVLIISRILCYLAVSVFSSLKDLKSSHKISAVYMLLIFFTSAFSIYLSVVLMLIDDSGDVQPVNIIVCIAGLLLINVSIVYLYDTLNKQYKKEADGKLLEQQNRFFSKQLEIMNQSQENIKFLKHNIKYHFNTLKTMIGDDKPVLEHINKFLQIVDDSCEYAKSGNIIVDSILNYKFQEAASRRTEIVTDLKIPRELNIQPFDMGIILGNLLDNAIAAVTKQESGRRVKVSMYFEKNVVYISIENTFEGRVIPEGDGYKTTKEDKINHGLGLQSVKKAIDKYNGEIDISNESGIFNVNVLLYDYLETYLNTV